MMASGGGDRNILLWRTPDYENISVLKSHTNSITSLAWMYNDRLVSCSADKSVCTWDVECEKVIRKHKGHTAVVHDVSVPVKTL